jgi:hypothetical protein
MEFLYHPAYGLTDEFRTLVLADAEAIGIPAAAEKHNVSTKSIQNWRKRADELSRTRHPAT